jgi:Multisubunit Na+/H+ antiporter, MnhF subunit
VIAQAVAIAFAMLTLALCLNVWRLVRGPSVLDRVLALDTMNINIVALLVVIGVWRRSSHYFEVALIIALVGFVGTAAFCKYVLRGDIIE